MYMYILGLCGIQHFWFGVDYKRQSKPKPVDVQPKLTVFEHFGLDIHTVNC